MDTDILVIGSGGLDEEPSPGEIKAKSTLGKGSKFLIKIPRSVPETARNRQM